MTKHNLLYEVWFFDPDARDADAPAHYECATSLEDAQQIAKANTVYPEAEILGFAPNHEDGGAPAYSSGNIPTAYTQTQEPQL